MAAERREDTREQNRPVGTWSQGKRVNRGAMAGIGSSAVLGHLLWGQVWKEDRQEIETLVDWGD